MAPPPPCRGDHRRRRPLATPRCSGSSLERGVAGCWLPFAGCGFAAGFATFAQKVQLMGEGAGSSKPRQSEQSAPSDAFEVQRGHPPIHEHGMIFHVFFLQVVGGRVPLNMRPEVSAPKPKSSVSNNWDARTPFPSLCLSTCAACGRGGGCTTQGRRPSTCLTRAPLPTATSTKT